MKFLETIRDEAHATIINEINRRDDIQAGNINNLTRQVEVLNDNILGNKMNHTKIESLSGNSVVDASQLNQLQNYLHESNEKNQQLLDTVRNIKRQNYKRK